MPSGGALAAQQQRLLDQGLVRVALAGLDLQRQRLVDRPHAGKVDDFDVLRLGVVLDHAGVDSLRFKIRFRPGQVRRRVIGEQQFDFFVLGPLASRFEDGDAQPEVTEDAGGVEFDLPIAHFGLAKEIAGWGHAEPGGLLAQAGELDDLIEPLLGAGAIEADLDTIVAAQGAIELQPHRELGRRLGIARRQDADADLLAEVEGI